LKIAIADLLFNWPPDGGARTDVKEIAERLARKHQVKLFVPHYTRFFPRGEVDRKFDFEVEHLSFRTRNFHALTVARAFRDAVRRWNPDRVYITDGWYLKPWLFAALREFRPLMRFYAYESLCLRFHGIFFRNSASCPVRYLDGGAKSWMTCMRCAIPPLRRPDKRLFLQEFLVSGAFLPGYRKRVRRMLSEASHLICYNEFIGNMIRPYNANTHIVPSGINPDDFPLQPRREGPGLELGMVGRAGDNTKGFPVLLDACRKLYAEGIPLRLHCTWSEPGLCSDPFVVRHNWMPPEKLPEFYSSLDICVVPSIWQEPFGIVALEAMSSGRPLICSDVGGLGSIPVDGESGLVVPAGQPEPLAEAIRRLYEDIPLRESMAIAARKRVEEKFTWDSIVERCYLPLFEQEHGG
jgi:glycosyltransferase involved in cell wall biosynthesis